MRLTSTVRLFRDPLNHPHSTRVRGDGTWDLLGSTESPPNLRSEHSPREMRCTRVIQASVQNRCDLPFTTCKKR